MANAAIPSWQAAIALLCMMLSGCLGVLPERSSDDVPVQNPVASLNSSDFVYSLHREHIQELATLLPSLEIEAQTPLDAVLAVIKAHKRVSGDSPAELNLIVLGGHHPYTSSSGAEKPLLTLSLQNIPTGKALELVADAVGFDVVVRLVGENTTAVILTEPFQEPLRTRIRFPSSSLLEKMDVPRDAKGRADVLAWFAARGVHCGRSSSAWYYPEEKVLALTNTGREVEIMDAIVTLYERSGRLPWP